MDKYLHQKKTYKVFLSHGWQQCIGRLMILHRITDCLWNNFNKWWPPNQPRLWNNFITNMLFYEGWLPLLPGYCFELRKTKEGEAGPLTSRCLIWPFMSAACVHRFTLHDTGCWLFSRRLSWCISWPCLLQSWHIWTEKTSKRSKEARNQDATIEAA